MGFGDVRGPALSLRRLPAALLPALLLALSAATAGAHEIRPAIADLTVAADGAIDIAIRLNLEALIAEIGPDHDDTADSPNAGRYERLRRDDPAQLAEAFDGYRDRLLAGIALSADGNRLALEFGELRIPPVGDTDLARDSELRLGAALPPGAETLQWHWDAGFGDLVLRAATPDDPEAYTSYLQNGESSAPIALGGVSAQTGWQVFADYIGVGFEHILPLGLDHILFVIGLFLLNARLRTLLWQVTSFTLAHSLTLGLGAFGLVTVSGAVVEPLIAASIVYVCVENVFMDRLSRWRPILIFLFGLLHGLGFASVLTEFGLSPAHRIAGLAGFNIGVELGQLTVIAGCLLAVGLWFRDKPWYRRRVTIPASLAIAAIGVYWVVERTLL